MARDEAYREAQWRIEAARIEGATELDLTNLGLTELPEEIGQLVNLEVLNLGYEYGKDGETNQLTELPKWLGNLTQLQRLDLYFNQLTTLPDSLRNLGKLEILTLSSNQFSSFPSIITHLQNLEEIYLIENDIKQLPDRISGLTRLRKLFLGGSQISPNAFYAGEEEHGNRLETLPYGIAELDRVVELNLDGNPLNSELAAAYQQGLEGIQAYLRALAEGKVLLNEAKLILVGEGEVGKTCLLGALRGDTWVEGRPTTHGIEIKPVTVTEDNTDITLNGWDFGGQRVYRPTHQLFFSAPAVYLVVWKPREGPQQGFVKEWITLIEHREPDAKVLVVATHGGPQQRQPDIDKQELIDLFGEETIQGFFFIDSKPDSATQACKNLDALKEKIASVAAALPGMGRAIPAKWHQVRAALQATGKPYISYKDAISICQEQGVEGFLAELCLRVYHTLGNIVHYHYDPLLKDIVILKPDWLAKAISFVLDDPETRRRNGLVEFEHLSQLWSHPPFAGETGYPRDLHPIFLRLMERFDLSYKVVLDAASPEDSTTSLIAQLVPDNRPQPFPWNAEPGAGERQQIQICRIVDDRGQLANAEGLFYQLIVRLHKYSLGRRNYEDSVHWQRGLILDDDYNGRAFLEHIDTNIRITVRAAYPEFFLHQLTHDVKWLVEHFWEGLRCEIVVPCIAPCGMNQPGRGQFKVEQLIDSKKQGRPEFPCYTCGQWQNIDELMRNAPTAPAAPQVLLSEQISDMQTAVQQIGQNLRVLDQRNHKRFQTLTQNQKVILSRVDEQFATLMQTFVDEAKEGPRLFSLKPMEPGFFDRPKWIDAKFQLTLWCEHSRQPLPQLNPDNPKLGVYELRLPREWFAKAAPYLKFMTSTIGLVLPVAASAGKAMMEETAYKSIEKELDLAQKSIEFSLKSSDIAVDWFGKRDTPDLDRTEDAIRAQGSMLRQLHSFLKEKDPSFGGLIRVQNKRQEFLWIHPQFVGEY